MPALTWEALAAGVVLLLVALVIAGAVLTVERWLDRDGE